MARQIQLKSSKSNPHGLDSPRANTQDRRELFALLEGREHLYAVAGHTHPPEHHYFGEDDGFMAREEAAWARMAAEERGTRTA